MQTVRCLWEKYKGRLFLIWKICFFLPWLFLFKCKQENELLMCDCCDRPFHMSCLDPPRTYIPEGRWFCKDCEKCVSCGVNLFQNYSRELLKLYSQQQVDNKIVCKDCWVYYKLKKYCPICFKIIEENEEGNFVNCD